MRSILAAGAVALAFTLFLTPVFLRGFRKLGWGQVIRTPEDEHNPSHAAKRGTLTMGGIVFVLGTVVGYLVGTFGTGTTPTVSGLLVLFMMAGFAVVGFIDDVMKVHTQRSLGLSGWRKIAGQLVVTVVFGVLALQFPDAYGQTPASGFISFFRDISVLNLFAAGAIVGWILYLLWISFIGVAWSNSTNVTDGLDGLATGIGICAIGAMSLTSFWQFQQACTGEGLIETYQSACYTVRDPLDLTIVAAAFVSSLVGFLWWNAPKAKVFMGDTGSMAIGGVIAALSVLSRIELLTVLMAGAFIIGSASVILQRVYFKLTHGRRLFLMSPLHHHFEMRGWPEVTIVVRMWLIGGLLAVTAVGLFYVEWLTLA